jgi:8-oxo-dGTP diphosphatase
MTEEGWVRCSLGHRHWGRAGAAGLLLLAPGAGPEPLVLLQRRARWTHHGGTWGLPGGACRFGESPDRTALRECDEELSGDLTAVRLGPISHRDDHGGWVYTTLVANAPAPLALRPRGRESTEVRWVPHTEVARMALHPGLAASWPALAGLSSPGPAP